MQKWDPIHGAQAWEKWNKQCELIKYINMFEGRITALFFYFFKYEY